MGAISHGGRRAAGANSSAKCLSGVDRFDNRMGSSNSIAPREQCARLKLSPKLDRRALHTLNFAEPGPASA